MRISALNQGIVDDLVRASGYVAILAIDHVATLAESINKCFNDDLELTGLSTYLASRMYEFKEKEHELTPTTFRTIADMMEQVDCFTHRVRKHDQRNWKLYRNSFTKSIILCADNIKTNRDTRLGALVEIDIALHQSA